MSKAFTKDEGHDEPVLRPLGPALPPHAKNYVTPQGASALRRRLSDAETEVERARRSHSGAELAHAQQSLEFLRRRLEAMEEVRPPLVAEGPIRFGATVEASDEEGRTRRLHIVGIDEADPARGDVSWTAPIAKALLGQSVGEEVTLPTPQGTVTLEILAVRYDA